MVRPTGFDLDGKVAVVTGGRGVGPAIVIGLAQIGADRAEGDRGADRRR